MSAPTNLPFCHPRTPDWTSTSVPSGGDHSVFQPLVSLAIGKASKLIRNPNMSPVSYARMLDRQGIDPVLSLVMLSLPKHLMHKSVRRSLDRLGMTGSGLSSPNRLYGELEPSFIRILKGVGGLEELARTVKVVEINPRTEALSMGQHLHQGFRSALARKRSQRQQIIVPVDGRNHDLDHASESGIARIVVRSETTRKVPRMSCASTGRSRGILFSKQMSRASSSSNSVPSM